MSLSAPYSDVFAGRVVEVGHVLEEGIPSLEDHTDFRHIRTSADGQALAFRLDLHEHVGTHVDAPCHWSPAPDPPAADAFEPFALIGECRVIDASAASQDDQLTSASNEGSNALDNAQGNIVLFRFDWDGYWSEPTRYLSGWPGLSAALARGLVDRGVKAVGTDAPAIDASGPHGMPAHEALLGACVPVIENLCCLGQIGSSGGLFIAVPLRIAGGSGSPIRPFVVVAD